MLKTYSINNIADW